MHNPKAIIVLLSICLIPWAKAEDKAQALPLSQLPYIERKYDLASQAIDSILMVYANSIYFEKKQAEEYGYALKNSAVFSDSMELLYINSVIAKKQLLFLDPTGELIQVREIEKDEYLRAARNGSLFCICKSLEERNERIPIGQAIIFDNHGKELIRVENINISGYGFNLHLPSYGTWILIDGYIADEGKMSIFFRDESKKDLRICTPSDETAKVSEFSFSTNGEYFICTGKSGSSSNDKSLLMLIDKSASIIWKKEITDFLHNYYSNPHISPNGNFITVVLTVVSEDWTSLTQKLEVFRKDGERVFIGNLGIGEYQIKFSKNEEYILANCLGKSLYLFDLTGNLLFEYESSNLEKNARQSFDISNDGSVAALEKGKIGARFLLFDRKGEIIIDEETQFISNKTNLSFSSDEKTLSLFSPYQINTYLLEGVYDDNQ